MTTTTIQTVGELLTVAKAEGWTRDDDGDLVSPGGNSFVDVDSWDGERLIVGDIDARVSRSATLAYALAFVTSDFDAMARLAAE